MPEVLPSIEPEGAPRNDSVHSDSMHSDSTFERSPTSPYDVACYERIWNLKEVASHDTQVPWEEGEEEEVKVIRELQKTNPQEHERRKRAYNLRKQGLPLAKLEKSSRRLPDQEIEGIWAGFLPPEVYKSTPTHKHLNASRSKHPKAEQRTEKRESRRLAGNSVEEGIYANRKEAKPIPKCLQRYPSTSKRNPAGLRSQASLKKSISVESAKPGSMRTRRSKRTGG